MGGEVFPAQTMARRQHKTWCVPTSNTSATGMGQLLHSQEPSSGWEGVPRDHAATMWLGGPACCHLCPRCPGWGTSGGLPCLPDSCPRHGRLFQVNVGPPRKLEELDPESREYWRLLRKHNIWRHNRLSKNRKF